MTEPTFGISISKQTGEPRAASVADMSIIGIIGTADSADAEKFPLNTPVFSYSDNTALATDLGASGTLLDAVTLINAQLGEFQTAAQLVFVRVDGSVDVATTISNIVGDGLSTGLAAFHSAGPDIGKIPRLIIAPGFTSQRADGVATLTIAAAGSGYDDGTYDLTATGGGGSGFAGTATVSGGAITAVAITAAGDGYETVPTIDLSDLTGGTGGSVTATVDDLANAVCAALPAHLSKLLAHAIVDGPGTNAIDAVAWRETMSSDRIIPVDPAVKVDESGSVVTMPMSPAIAGLAVRVDHEKTGLPFWSWANRPLYGIVGPSRPISFSLTDGATEGQTLLAANIGILIRGEMGVESAIASGGFVFVGTDNAGADSLWQFYNQTRGRDYIHLALLRTIRGYLGQYNLTGQTIQAILNTMESLLRDLQADGALLGYKVGFERDQNSPENLRAGRFTVDFRAEEPAVLRRVDVRSFRYRPALNALLDDLIAQIDI